MCFGLISVDLSSSFMLLMCCALSQMEAKREAAMQRKDEYDMALQREKEIAQSLIDQAEADK